MHCLDELISSPKREIQELRKRGDDLLRKGVPVEYKITMDVVLSREPESPRKIVIMQSSPREDRMKLRERILYAFRI